jgi:hypothetical protein
MTMTVRCRRCGHAFETAATTNTRCRQCRTVVNIGRTVARPVEAAGAPMTPDPADNSSGLSPRVLGAGLGAVGAYALYRGISIRTAPNADRRAVRRSRLRWCVVGVVSLGTGVWLLVR